MMMTLEQEREAFDRQLDDLLKDQAGRFAVFKDGHPVAFFDDETKAYEEALRRFGADDGFLIAKVERDDPRPISASQAP